MLRIFALLGQIFIAVLTLAALAWWLANVGVRLSARRLEWRSWFRRGRPWPTGLALCGIFLLIAGLIVALVWYLTPFLAPSTAEEDPHWLVRLWQRVIDVVTLILCLAAVGAAASQAASAWGAAKRRRLLTDLRGSKPTPVPPPLTAAPPAPEGRRIVVFCDGTSNSPDQKEDGAPATTNVWKLYRALESDETQVTWYQAGVGSDTSSTAQQVRFTHKVLDTFGAKTGAFAANLGSGALKLMEAMSGAGISDGITRGYAQIARQYRPGDRIYLVGFSRGAYTARCIAGVISRCGLLRAEHLRYAPEVVQLYRSRRRPGARAPLRRDMVHPDVTVEFLGNFDSVASLGTPLWGWWFRLLPIWKNKAFATDPASVCRHVYHALSMDERRSQFFPTLFTRPGPGTASRLVTLEQRWFRGAHGDIGGGYANTALSDIPLAWMMDAMSRHGLTFQKDARKDLRRDPLGRMHDELERNPSWRVFGSWPRWHPVPAPDPAPDGSRLHPSVLRRASASHRRLGRPDLWRLKDGESVEFDVEARRDWDRTGIVIETGVVYELTYLGGTWRDAEAGAASPAGQDAGWLDLRRYLGWGRRRRHEPWLRLIGTIAHPRPWEPHERGILTLIRLLLFNDPPELQRQLASFGRDLSAPSKSITLRSQAPAGLLHLYANDWWQTASNNSGAVRLRIARAAAGGGAPAWTLDRHGGWSRNGEPMMPLTWRDRFRRRAGPSPKAA